MTEGLSFPIIVKILSYLKDTYILDLLYRTVSSIRKYGDPLIGRIREYRRLRNGHNFMRFLHYYPDLTYIFHVRVCTNPIKIGFSVKTKFSAISDSVIYFQDILKIRLKSDVTELYVSGQFYRICKMGYPCLCGDEIDVSISAHLIY